MTMADIDPASKRATLAHMNKDHQLDLGLYLRHVNGLSAEQLAAEGAPEMVDMDLAAMHIRTAASGRVHLVPLEPPMAAWGERRQRLVALALEARAAFGVPLPEHGDGGAVPGPSATGNKAAGTPPSIPFTPPTPAGFVVLSGVVLYAVVAALVLTGRDAAVAGLWAAALDALGLTEASFVYGGAAGFRRLVRQLLVPVLAIHATEVLWLDRTRLAPHGIARFSRRWWLWMGTTFWEGFTAFQRFDRLVQAARARP